MGAPFAVAAQDRFEIIRRLGEGGMGIVYEAHDRELDARVALKTLHDLDPHALLRLKNEFQVLLDLSHPNLVRLGELFARDGHWFFTMELIEGVDFLAHVWARGTNAVDGAGGSDAGREAFSPTLEASDLPEARPSQLPRPSAPRVDEGRLRDALRQLASGLSALHAVGKVHRDVKPSNVLVDRTGRVVLLDFGLATDAHVDRRSEAGAVGTVAYMAPEQAMGKAIGPEADWYAVGVVLYEALTGRVPFEGRPLQVLMDKQGREPAAPAGLADRVPLDLNELCVELLRFDPAARPKGPEILRRLGVHGGPGSRRTAPASGGSSPPFVGRVRELEALESALAAPRAVTMLLTGESGIGKTSLVRRFTESLAQRALVLSGRCYERASVPYKAVDGIIDELSHRLRRMRREAVDALLPVDANLLAIAFPVLGRVEALASIEWARRGAFDAQQLRSRAFAALRELIARLAAQRKLVLVVDDLHWADADSLSLLAELVRPPQAPPVLLLATLRAAAAADARVRGIASAFENDVRNVHVAPLAQADAERLARALLEQAGERDAERAAAIAREAAGHPLFLDELVRHASGGGAAPARFDDALVGRLAQLETAALGVLDLVCVAGTRLSHETIARAAGVELGALARMVGALRVANLVRTTGTRAADAIEPYHDRVREAVVARLSPDTWRTANERLALAIGTGESPDVEALAVHWLEAGDHGRAARYYVEAAQHAARALAFAHAAKLYERALQLGRFEEDEARTLRARRGDALADAGLGRAAADAYLEASEGASAAEALDLRRRAADQLLRSGHVDDGLRVLEGVLARVGVTMPRTPGAAVRSLLMRRAWLRLRGLRWREQQVSQIAPDVLTRIDVCWSAGVGLDVVDHIRGADFQTRTLLLSLQAGEPLRVARALAMESAVIASVGGRGASRAKYLLSSARELAERIGDPKALALVRMVAGSNAFMIGEWQRAIDCFDEAAPLLRDRCTGVAWEVDSMGNFRLGALYALGRAREMLRIHPELLRDALLRGDLYAATNLRTGTSNAVWLVSGEPERAVAEADEAMRLWSQRGFHVQHVYDVMARCAVDLYRGRGEESLARLAATEGELRSSRLMGVQILGHVILDLRARSAIAAALAHPAGSGRRLELTRAAERDLARIEREGMPWSYGMALLARGCVASTRGDLDAARRSLQAAVETFREHDSRLLGAVAQARLASLEGGDEGAAMSQRATEVFAAEHVAEPARLAAMLAPWPQQGP
ncbi:MAG TPA: protein kinase [Polyangiaceae bacterium]|nr:protein kinase [Polyangiaceae bacterium]